MNDAIARELASYEGRLEDMGFHPKSVGAYSRKLREFLETSPHVLDASEADSATAIETFIVAAAVAHDDHTRAKRHEQLDYLSHKGRLSPLDRRWHSACLRRGGLRHRLQVVLRVHLQRYG